MQHAACDDELFDKLCQLLIDKGFYEDEAIDYMTNNLDLFQNDMLDAPDPIDSTIRGMEEDCEKAWTAAERRQARELMSQVPLWIYKGHSIAEMSSINKPRVGRNAPCPCGSGRKEIKNCCGRFQ